VFGLAKENPTLLSLVFMCLFLNFKGELGIIISV
jgi:hypothetical protein